MSTSPDNEYIPKSSVASVQSSTEPSDWSWSEEKEDTIVHEDAGPSFKKARLLIIPRGVKAECWSHFKVYEDDPNIAKCDYCDTEIKRLGGTSHLSDHLKVCQFKEIAARKRKGFVELFSNRNQSTSLNTTGPLDKFVKVASDFPTHCTKWIVMTKQSFETVETALFRKMCYALNPKVEALAVKKVKDIVTVRTALCEAAISSQLENNHYAITNDAWTSRRNQSYTAITVHWIEEDFVLRSCALGCQPKEGRSQAVDHVNDIEIAMERFDLKYNRLIASVTDTDATMISAGRLLQDRARNVARASEDQTALDTIVQWHGCIDHILELTTGIAFKDIPESEGTMARCRSLVTFFNQSSTATKVLLDLQTTMNTAQGRRELHAVNVIQDVVTRW